MKNGVRRQGDRRRGGFEAGLVREQSREEGRKFGEKLG